MPNLKTTLQSRWVFIPLLIFACLNAFFVLKKDVYKSSYQGYENNISGYIMSLTIDGNHLKIILKAKEKIIVNYYIKTEKELETIKSDYQLGDYIKVEGDLVRPSSNNVFNLFNYRNYLLSQKVYWIFNSSGIKKINMQPQRLYLMKQKIINRLDKTEKSSAYIKNYLLAETNDIDANVLNSYQENGLNHLLSLSGTQLSLFATIIMFVINKMSKHKTVNYIIVTLILLFYLFLSSYPPSLLRAFLLFVLLRINEIFKLKVTTINYMIFIFSILLLYNPYYVYHLGFKFSFIISFYLTLFKDVINRNKNYLVKMFIVSIIAFLVSIPILINNFFEINLLTPITNMIFIPIFLFVIFPFSIIVFIIPALDNLLYIIINFTESLSLLINGLNITLQHIPILVIIGYYLVITFVLISFRNKRYWNFIYIPVVLLCHFYSPYFNSYPVVTFIDVGQGDSTLIELPKMKGNILIDTGGIINYNNKEWSVKKNKYSIALSKTIPYLKSRGIRKLDYLILTHGDYDHLGEAEILVDNFIIDNVIFNSGYNNDIEEQLIKLLEYKKIPYVFFNQAKLTLNNNLLYFLNQKNTINENEDSLIVYTKLNNVNILLTGDAGISSEKYLMSTYNLPKMDILKLGHHGSRNSSSKDFIDKLKPKYAVISAGLNNRYNHPHQEVIELLNDNHIDYYLTSLHGSIKFILKKQIVIKTCSYGYANRVSV